MAKGVIEVARNAIVQPNRSTSRKSQKRQGLKEEYDGALVNNELDYVHERINLVVVEVAAVADLDPAASTAEIVARINYLTETMRSAGLLKRE